MTRQRIQTGLTALRDTVTRLHRDDRGAEGLEKLLIVAVVVLPLLGVLIFFRDAINDWVNNSWDDVVTPGEAVLPPPTNIPNS